MTRLLLLLSGIVLWAPTAAPAATVLFCPFDSLEGWSVRALGPTRAAIVETSPGGPRCAQLAARAGTVMLSRELPLREVRGSRIELSCLVESHEVVPGPQVPHAARLHLAVATPAGVAHYSARLPGSSEWHREGFTADVPQDASRVVLNLGLEACSGRVRFRQLLVRSDRRGVYSLDLSQVANGGHEQLGIGAFPEGTVEWEGIPFRILDAAGNDGRDCLRLKGIGHEDWPAHTGSPIPVGRVATAVYVLDAALDGREKSETPCALWTAQFAGGPSSGLSVFEGRQIGAIGRTEDLDEWHVAWRGKDSGGGPVTFGVTKWALYSDAPVVSLSCKAYHGAAPVVLAVTVVEEPPEPEPEGGIQEFDEFGEPIGGNE